MARRKPLRPKVPRRSDSKEVVEAILDAATLLLQEEGLEGFTTNHIAARAGVGVASVYRYFADKEAIIASLDHRNRIGNAEALRGLVDLLEQDLALAVRAMLHFFLETSGPRGRLRRAIVSEVPISWVAPNATQTLAPLIDTFTGALRKVLPNLPEAEIRRRLHVSFHAVQGVTVGQLVFPFADVDLETAVSLMEPAVLAILLAPHR